MSIEQIHPLRTLAYRSKAIANLSVADLDAILVRSRIRNQKAQVTGVLVFMHGAFMQYLEGPDQGIVEVYECIKASQLHRDIEELSSGRIAVRQYPDWSMTYFSGDLKSKLPLTFDHPPGETELAGSQQSASQAQKSPLSDFLEK